MTLEQFEKIMALAKGRMNEYLDMDKRVNYDIPVTRKENFLSYWIAAVAFEEGMKH